MPTRVRADQPQVLQQAQVVLEGRVETGVVALPEVLDRLRVQVALRGRQGKLAARVHDDLLRQILGDIGLRAPQNLRRDATAQFLDPSAIFIVSCFDRLAVTLSEVVQRTEQARLHEVEQAPEVCQRVLDGRAGTGDLEADVLLLRGPSDHGRRVFDALSLVAHHQRPALGGE
jgi:predicted nucleotide-binding protein